MTASVTDQPLPDSAQRGDVVALGRDYIHHDTAGVIDLVAETGCAVHLLNCRSKHAYSTGVVIVRVEDAAQWVRQVIENERAAHHPAALTIAEAAELTGVTTSAIRQRRMRARNGAEPVVDPLKVVANGHA